MAKKIKISLFLKLFILAIGIVAFSNLLLAFTLYNGYKGILLPATPYLPADLYENLEVGIGNTWLLVAILSFVILLITTLFVVIFISSILGPVRRILEAMEKVRKGNLQVEVEINTGDEIEELGIGFNQMIKELNKMKEALEEEKKVLEIKVRARTRELKELTEALEEQVLERTRELRESQEKLQKKVEELEKFHRLAVGRELRMLELKKRISELEKQLSEKKNKIL